MSSTQTPDNFLSCLGLANNISQNSKFFKSVASGDACRVWCCLQQAPNLIFHQQSLSGWTAWHLAAANGHANVLLELWRAAIFLGPGSLVKAMNSIDQKSQTPLMCGCSFGQDSTVRLLLAMGADPWIPDKNDRQVALHYAARGGHVGCIEAVMETVPLSMRRLIDSKTTPGHTPLHYAVCYGQVNAMNALLALGADQCAQTTSLSAAYNTPRGYSPLHLAGKHVDLACTVEFLKHYATTRRVHTSAEDDSIQHDEVCLGAQDLASTSYKSKYADELKHGCKDCSVTSDGSRGSAQCRHRAFPEEDYVTQEADLSSSGRTQYEVVHSVHSTSSHNGQNALSHLSKPATDPRGIKDAEGRLPWQVVSTHLQHASTYEAVCMLLKPDFPLDLLLEREAVFALLGRASLPLQLFLHEHSLELQIQHAEQQLGTKALALSLSKLHTRDQISFNKIPNTLNFPLSCAYIERMLRLEANYMADMYTEISSVCSLSCTQGTAAVQSTRRSYFSFFTQQTTQKHVCSTLNAVEAYDDNKENSCKICMDCDATLRVEGCNHMLCCKCARSLLRTRRPLKEFLCPFCRQSVNSFLLGSVDG